MFCAQSTTKDYIRAEHKLHSISKLVISQVIIPQVKFFLAYLYSTGTQDRNLPLAEWPFLFCGPTQEPCVSHSQQRKNWERFWKNAGEWIGKVEIGKEEIPGSKRSKYGYIHLPTPGFKGRTFKLCVLTRWDFNFCVRSSPLRGHGKSPHSTDMVIMNWLPVISDLRGFPCNFNRNFFL